MVDFDQSKIFPIPLDVEEGKVYLWCGCGESKTQPLCDGSGFCLKSVSYEATLTETVYFCSCKRSKAPPLCDGSHVEVLREYLQKMKHKT